LIDAAVILSPGRTGSSLIRQNLLTCFKSVEHTHQATYKPQNKNTIGVISYRRDDFAAIMSMFLGAKNNEHTKYSNQYIEPFAVDLGSFEKYYVGYHMFYKFIKTEYYAKTIAVYYDDMIQDPKYLFSLFGIDATTDYTVTEKSPRKAIDFIINFIELKELHSFLEKDKVNILAASLETFHNVG
jgi:hypothetical protein